MSSIVLPHNDHKWLSVKAALSAVVADPFSYKKQYSSLFPDYDLSVEHLTLLDFLAARALEIESLFPSETFLTALRVDVTGEVVLSQRQVLCLLCNAFFDTFPSCTFDGQPFTFREWKQSPECLKCFMVYVKACQARIEKSRHWTGSNISYSRRGTTFSPDMLADCTRDLSYVSVACCPDSAIEKSIDCFHADFANALVGGSVLFGGFAQEEIRFLIAPECLITILLCEKMEDKESILIRGSEQFSTYMGYGHNFSCTGSYDGLPPRMDDSGFLCTFVVAMDATPFDGDGVEQYDAAHSHREITKCVAALDVWACEQLEISTRRAGHVFYRAFATGNWGCGAFGGNPQFKFLLQWLAASLVGRDLIYFPFNDPRMEELGAITTAISQRQTRTDKRLIVSMEERGCGMVFEERGGLERGAFIAQRGKDRGLHSRDAIERYNVGIEDDPINVSTLYQWTMEYAVSRTADDGGELSVFDFIARKMRNDD